MTDEIELARLSVPVERYNKVAAVYFLLRDGKIKYIGRSKDLYTRLCLHWRGRFRNTEAFYIKTLPSNLPKLELEMIRRFMPPKNIVGNDRKLLKKIEQRVKRRSRI